jgi:hypothetical protein
MAGGLGAKDRQKLAEIEAFQQRVQHLHGLVERFAAERTDLTPHINALVRAFGQMKLTTSGAGYDSLSQLCASMEIASRRTGSKPFKTRVLREGVASMRMQLEVAQRAVHSEAKRPADEEEAAKE